MSAAIPTFAPRSVIAGNTVTWQIGLSDYPATDGWTLTYAMNRRAGGLRILLTSTATGSDHLISEAATTTLFWLPGIYDVQGYVTNASERFSVWDGIIEVKPNLAAAEDGADTRSLARKIFDALEEGMLKVATAQGSTTAGGAITEWQCEGLRIKRSSSELLLQEMTRQRDRYASIVRIEDEKISRAAGRGTGRRIVTRFTIP